MSVRAYLRASTDDQDATRAREALRTFAAEHGTRIAATYVENASGTLLDRRELLRLLADCSRSPLAAIGQKLPWFPIRLFERSAHIDNLHVRHQPSLPCLFKK